MEIEGKLVGDAPKSLGTDGRDPYLEPSHDAASIKFLEDGSITFEGTSNFTPRIEPFNCPRFECTEIRRSKGH